MVVICRIYGFDETFNYHPNLKTEIIEYIQTKYPEFDFDEHHLHDMLTLLGRSKNSRAHHIYFDLGFLKWNSSKKDFEPTWIVNNQSDHGFGQMFCNCCGIIYHQFEKEGNGTKYCCDFRPNIHKMSQEHTINKDKIKNYKKVENLNFFVTKPLHSFL